MTTQERIDRAVRWRGDAFDLHFVATNAAAYPVAVTLRTPRARAYVERRLLRAGRILNALCERAA